MNLYILKYVRDPRIEQAEDFNRKKVSILAESFSQAETVSIANEAALLTDYNHHASLNEDPPRGYRWILMEISLAHPDVVLPYPFTSPQVFRNVKEEEEEPCPKKSSRPGRQVSA